MYPGVNLEIGIESMYPSKIEGYSTNPAYPDLHSEYSNVYSDMKGGLNKHPENHNVAPSNGYSNVYSNKVGKQMYPKNSKYIVMDADSNVYLNVNPIHGYTSIDPNNVFSNSYQYYPNMDQNNASPFGVDSKSRPRSVSPYRVKRNSMISKREIPKRCRVSAHTIRRDCPPYFLRYYVYTN